MATSLSSSLSKKYNNLSTWEKRDLTRTRSLPDKNEVILKVAYIIKTSVMFINMSDGKKELLGFEERRIPQCQSIKPEKKTEYSREVEIS